MLFLRTEEYRWWTCCVFATDIFEQIHGISFYKIMTEIQYIIIIIISSSSSSSIRMCSELKE